MTETQKYEIGGKGGIKVWTGLPVGTTVTLLNGAVGTITANPHDGGYVQVDWQEHPIDPSKVGKQEFVFFNEVQSATRPDGSTEALTSIGVATSTELDAEVDLGSLEGVILQQSVERFLYKEARLLDERRLVEWLNLLDTDLHYWMPMRRNIKFGEWDREFTDSETEINWFNEGKDILEGRIRQLNTGVHWPEEPVSRFEHIVTNVEIVDVTGDEICVNSKFFCYQNRLQDEVNTWVGRREDLLRRDSETGFKIVKRKIILAQNVMLPKVVNTFF
jgi:3-phenylpropionate/cinnamic acid dioxygenase small subunit